MKSKTKDTGAVFTDIHSELDEYFFVRYLTKYILLK